MYNNNPTHERGLRNPNHPNTQQPPTGLTYGQSPASGPAPTTAGHHKHDLLNKLDPRIDSTHDRQPMSQTTTAGGSSIREGTYGPHSSKVANALDPRVDSDLDSARAGAGMGPGGGTQTAAAVPGAVPGGAGMGAGGGMMGAGAGLGGTARRGHAGEAAEGTYGPHTSRVANALDPRVDSDRDRHVGPGATRAPGAVMGGHGAAAGAPVTGGHGAMGTTSTATAAGGGAGGSGAGVAAPHTAGPHKSGLLNKLDPRVDSQTGAFKSGSGTRGGY